MSPQHGGHEVRAQEKAAEGEEVGRLHGNRGREDQPANENPHQRPIRDSDVDTAHASEISRFWHVTHAALKVAN